MLATADPLYAGFFRKSNKEGQVYWYGDSKTKSVAITFDDGPNEVYTPKVLDILKVHDVKATFFVLGKYVDDYREITRRIVNEGHALGNHGYYHHDLRFEFASGINSEVKKAEDAIVRAVSIKPYMFRPPYGGYNSRIGRIMKQLGYITIEYSLTSSDGGKKTSKESILKKVLPKVKNGSIILMHDGDCFSKDSKRSATIAALPVIITTLKEQGYSLVTVPELLKIERSKR